jgi:hypothetical protein
MTARTARSSPRKPLGLIVEFNDGSRYGVTTAGGELSGKKGKDISGY